LAPATKPALFTAVLFSERRVFQDWRMARWRESIAATFWIRIIFRENRRPIFRPLL
jgi:hypothetical protein